MTGKALAAVTRASQVAVWFGGLALIAVALLVTVEVILRRVFLIGLSAAAELSAYTLAISTAWAYAFSLFQRNHVRVDAVVRLLPRRAVVWVDLLALAALTWFAGLLVFHGYRVLEMTLERGARAMTPLATPLWIPQSLWLLGLTVFLIACVVLFAHATRLLAAGQVAAVSDLIGTFSREEEAEVEAGQAAERAREPTVPRS